MSTDVPMGKDIDVRFEVLENDGALLRARYEAANVGTSDLYLFNRLWRTYTEQNVFELDANLVYIKAQGNNAWLLKGIPDIPENVHVEMPVVPCVTTLQRGQRTDETLQIKLPLRPFDPYMWEEQPVIQNPAAVVFSLGYFRVSEIGNRPVNYVRSTLGQALYAYVTPWEQLRVSTAPAPFRAVSAPAGGPRFCRNCGAKQAAGNRFCGQCGTPL